MPEYHTKNTCHKTSKLRRQHQSQIVARLHVPVEASAVATAPAYQMHCSNRNSSQLRPRCERMEHRAYEPTLAWVVLGLLVVQNAATTMLVQHTRRHPAANGVVYLGSVAVLISECLKLPTCLALIVNDEGGIIPAAARIKDSVFDRWKDTLRMSVPALCYGLQNLLFFVALSNLSATSYQLWSQTKVLFTALFFHVRFLLFVLLLALPSPSICSHTSLRPITIFRP